MLCRICRLLFGKRICCVHLYNSHSLEIAVVELDYDALAAVKLETPIQQHRFKGRQQLGQQLR